MLPSKRTEHKVVGVQKATKSERTFKETPLLAKHAVCFPSCVSEWVAEFLHGSLHKR